MPIYEYICLRCDEKFSVLQGVSSTETEVVCPKCASRSIKRIIFIFSCASGSKNDSSSISSPLSSGKG